MTRKTRITTRDRQDAVAPPPATSPHLPKPILRPVSDPIPGAPDSGRTMSKGSKGPFSSLTFAAGTALGGGGGTKKQRKGVLGFFHKKDGSSDASSSTSSLVSSGANSPSPESVSSGLPTPTSPTFANFDDPKLSKGSVGRGLWNRLTGTIREPKSSGMSMRAKDRKHSQASTGPSVELSGSLSHAPPFPWKRSIKPDDSTGQLKSTGPPKTLSSVFAPPGLVLPPHSSRADKPRTISSTGPLSRAPLGNVFLGPLPNSPERRPSSMDQATQPEMAIDGLETVVASGLESLRVRTLSRVEPRTRVRSIGDVFAAPTEEEMPRQTSLSVINKANRTLLDLVARLEQSAASSPETSPVKAAELANPAGLSPLAIRKRAKPTAGLAQLNTDSAQSLLFLRKPKSAARRVVPKASSLTKPLADLRPTVDVVMEKSGVAFTPGTVPVGFGQTVGVDQVVRSTSSASAEGPHSDEESHPGSDVPEDLQDIISEKDDGSSRGSGSWSDHRLSPASPVLGLPSPPPPNRISPRRNGPLTLEVPPLRITSWHSRSQKSSDDTSAVSPADRRDSSTFDFTGEIDRLNENARASFFDTLHASHSTEPPVFPSLHQQALAAAEQDAVVAGPKTSKSSSSSGSSTPLGALNRDFKLGSRPPSRSPPSVPQPANHPRQSFEAPVFRVSAPTPLPPDSPRLDASAETTFGDSTIEDLEVDDVLPDESYDESKRFSFLSESSTTRRGHRRTGHGESATSFASFGSISSVGHVIHPGSRHPFSFDYSDSNADDSLSPDRSLDSSDTARTRKESELSVLTQSSFGAPLVNGNRLSEKFEFSSFRNGQLYAGSRHGHTDSIDSVASTFSFHAPTDGSSSNRHHRRSSSIASVKGVGSAVAAGGPPISRYNQARPFNWKAQRHARNDSADSANSSRSSLSRIPRATGRPDWARHRAQQSSADSAISAYRGGGRPGLGDRMFSPDQAVPLFPISASPNASPDDSFRSDSFQLERMLRQTDDVGGSDSSDTMSVDECRTSIDSGFPNYRFVHEREPSLDESAESVFGAGDDSFLRPFVPRGPRPLSGHSQLSSDGDDVDLENDTFAFKHSKPAAQLELPIMDKTRGKERPLSALSSNASDIEHDDTFAFKNPDEASEIIQPTRYTLPVLRAEIHPRGPPQPSPLRTKRKDDRDVEASRARKARLVSAPSPAAAVQTFTKGLQERASLEDSCLTGDGEDASFNSSDLAHFHQAFRITAPSQALSKPRPPNARKKPTRPQPLAFSPAALPDTPPLTGSTSFDSSRLSLELNRLSLDSASSSGTSARKAKFVPGHYRSRASGPSTLVNVQATIQEELSDGGGGGNNAFGGGPPGLSRSQSSSPASDTYDFPSPIFLLSREPDIVAFDDDPTSYEVIRGWRTWERDAQFEYSQSRASWMDTDHSQEEIAHFTPPKKLSQVEAFLTDSARAYKRLSSSFLKHKRSSSLADSRLQASPYYVDSSAPPSKAARGARARPTSIKTKFSGSEVDGCQPDSARLATSAKFAAFAPLPSSASASRSTSPAAARALPAPASPPPTIAVFEPVSPLRVPFLVDQHQVDPNLPSAAAAAVSHGPNEGSSLKEEPLAKKARRVSSNVRRERLGWGRRKTSVDHGAEVAPAVKPKRSSLQVQRDPPAILTKLRPASLDNKENVAGGGFGPGGRPRPFRLATMATTVRANPLRA